MKNFGVYIHVPFCAHRCDYCAFATYSDRDHLMADYVDAVRQEIPWAKEQSLGTGDLGLFRWRNAVSSDARSIAQHPSRGANGRGLRGDRQCNPEDASLERLVAYKDGGVTRMSFGVQSTQPRC